MNDQFFFQINGNEIDGNEDVAYVLEKFNNTMIVSEQFYQRESVIIEFSQIPSGWMRFINDIRPRHQATSRDIDKASNDVYQHLLKTIKKKGSGIFVSSHETSGVLMEELKEFQDEVHANNSDGQLKELHDIATAAIFGIISIKSGKMDW